MRDHSHSRGKKRVWYILLVFSIGSLPLAWEKWWENSWSIALPGLLPRVWEKEYWIYCSENSFGITPTRVGKHGQNKHFEFILSWNFLQQSHTNSHTIQITSSIYSMKEKFCSKNIIQSILHFFCKEKPGNSIPGLIHITWFSNI